MFFSKQSKVCNFYCRTAEENNLGNEKEEVSGAHEFASHCYLLRVNIVPKTTPQLKSGAQRKKPVLYAVNENEVWFLSQRIDVQKRSAAFDVQGCALHQMN